MMTAVSSALANESYEIVSFKYKVGISLNEQQRSLEKLNDIVSRFKGFKSRVFYYSEENERWFDFVTWETLDDAKRASKQVMENPEALSIFGLMDENSIIFSHYKKVGGVSKDQL